MSEKREDVYQILELGKHEKNLHHKKGFGGLLFIDLSMIKFSKLSSYIRQLDKENEELKQQLHDASIQIQELTEQDIWCPSNCEKLEKLQQENKHLDKVNCKLRKTNEQLKDNWIKLRKWIVYNKHNENTEQHYLVVDYGMLLGKMRELQGSDNK